MSQLSNKNLEMTFTRLRQSLLNYLRTRLPDSNQAEDLVQDIFVKALQSKHAGRHIENLTGWLFAVARTTLVDHLRIKGLAAETLDENIQEQEAEDLQLHEEIANCLKPFIAELPAIYRDTLIATDIEGVTQRAYANEQALSESAIKSRVARGRGMLKDRLLSCCHIEMKDGLVSDYHASSQTCCAEK